MLVDSRPAPAAPGPPASTRSRSASGCSARRPLHALSPDRGQPWSCPPPDWNPGSRLAHRRTSSRGLDLPWLQHGRPAHRAGGAPAPRRAGADRGEARLPAMRSARPSCRCRTCWPPASWSAPVQVLAGLLTDNDTRRRPRWPVRRCWRPPCERASARGPPGTAPAARPRRVRTRRCTGAHRGAAVRDHVQRGRARSRSPWSTISTSRSRSASRRHRASGGLTITRPDPVTLGPGQRTSMRLAGHVRGHRRARGHRCCRHRRRRARPVGQHPVQRPHQPGRPGHLGDHGRRRRRAVRCASAIRIVPPRAAPATAARRSGSPRERHRDRAPAPASGHPRLQRA